MSTRRSKKENMLHKAAIEMIDALRDCEDGTVTSTGRLARDFGYDDLGFEELMYLQQELFKAAKAARITLDMSEHEGKVEGLAYNLPYVVRNADAQIKCPRCGSSNTARYLYGMPAFSEELDRDLKSGKVVLGGCCINDIEIGGRMVRLDSMRFCNECRRDFAGPPIVVNKKAQEFEDYRDIVTAVQFEQEENIDNAAKIVITRNEDGALVQRTIEADGDENTKKWQIGPDEWQQLIDAMYEQLYLHEWKKRYVDRHYTGFDSWFLSVKLEANRHREIHGHGLYPAYWKELKELFQQYIENAE